MSGTEIRTDRGNLLMKQGREYFETRHCFVQLPGLVHAP